MNIKKILILTCFIIIMLNCKSYGQEKSEVKSLNIKDCIQIALQNNLLIDIAETKLKSSNASVDEITAQKYPKIKLNGSLSKYDYETGFQDVIFENSSESIPNFPRISLKKDNFDAHLGIEVEQLLYDGGRTDILIKGAEIEKEASKLNCMGAQEKVSYNVKLAFYGALKAREKFNIAEENIKNVSTHLELCHALFNQGIVPSVDALTAEVALEKSKMLSNYARNEYEKALANLNMAMGRKINEITELEDDGIFIPVEIDEEKAINKALECRIELKQMKSSLEEEEKNVNIGEMALSPTITANAGYIVRNEDSMGKRNFYMGLGVNFPVFNIPEYTAKKEKALATLEEMKKQKELLIQQVNLEVYNAMLDLKSAGESAKISVKEIEIAGMALKASEARYKEGVGTIVDLTESQLNFIKAKTDYLDSLYNYKIAVATLEHAMGTNIEEIQKKGEK